MKSEADKLLRKLVSGPGARYETIMEIRDYLARIDSAPADDDELMTVLKQASEIAEDMNVTRGRWDCADHIKAAIYALENNGTVTREVVAENLRVAKAALEDK